VTLTSAVGCDSVATLVLAVNDVLTSTINVSICTSQLPYTGNGETFDAAGTYDVTLTSTAGCDSIATLVLTVNPVLTSTTAVTVCENELPYTWNGETFDAAGTYDVTLTNSAGCDSIATLVLTVNPVLTSTTTITICENELPYTWNGDTFDAAGTYDVTLTNSAGCDSIATLVLTVNPVLTSTTTITICENELPYTWNGQTFNVAGTYDVTLTSSASCDSVATLVLTVNVVLTSTTNVSICTSQLPYTWNGEIFEAAGTYDVTLINSAGCDSVATLVLAVNDVLTSATNISICTSQLPYTWNGQTFNDAGTY